MTMSTDTGIAVLHLVRARNPTSALAAFLKSYQRYPAGAPHRLIILLKGFADGVPYEIDRLLAPIIHERIYCPDTGFDIGSYMYGIERISEPLVLLTNSFTEFATDGWLGKLLAAIILPSMGAVGATGSWESFSSRFFHEPMDMARPWPLRIVRRVWSLIIGAGLFIIFPKFPNVHLRTNGLLIRRVDFITHRHPPMRFKIQAWMFESGRWSLSRCLIRRGLRLAIVDRDGTVYAPEEWEGSSTFWQGEQSNLLIHDNQTRMYANGSENFRCRKRFTAWACRPRG